MAIFSLEKNELEQLYDTLLHKGIHTYKQKNSRADLAAQSSKAQEEIPTRQGAIFVVQNKKDFSANGVKGYVVTSKELLREYAHNLSHFTPNVYRTFGYSDKARRMIYGFEECNLQQINMFVVDIDTKKFNVNHILLTCMDESIGLPTLIVESERGYQLFFALSAPFFISNQFDYRSLKVAKRISNNLKRSLQSIEVDMYCNDFGFFRLPTEKNIVYKDFSNLYSVAELINWSMRQDDDMQRPLFMLHSKALNQSVTDTDWFKALVNITNLKGAKGVLGRNNLLFTIALIGYSEGWSESATKNFLMQCNARFDVPLKMRELIAIVKSAFSNKYNGANKAYIQAYLTMYVAEGDKFTVELGTKGWYKFKKAREERSRSHFDEWEEDIITYIKAQKTTSEPFIWRTQKELCKAIGIPQSTLNEVLKRSTRIKKKVVGKGRAARTGFTTQEILMQYQNQQVKECKENKSYIQHIKSKPQSQQQATTIKYNYTIHMNNVTNIHTYINKYYIRGAD